ncbi:MAG TPA: hypothetical protein IAA06_05050 [Candidatus Blautia faecavium]|uniref:Uncharacterized protein n=1 Tax=Candidatus Blautia faecavium TaxID=2838487 RepID=A0A9D2LRL3_9FIRM|nr:hypothetical protein [Candidatus Blautia faecavium]
MENELMRREIGEAVAAGERALSSLYLAQEKLDSARKWGIYDMIGGGFFGGLMKHSRMNDAASYLEDAKQDLKVFQRELRDVHLPMDVHVDIGSFLTFADFFFDGLIVDYMVQAKIAEARRQVDEAALRVETLLSQLKGLLLEG